MIVKVDQFLSTRRISKRRRSVSVSILMCGGVKYFGPTVSFK